MTLFPYGLHAHGMAHSQRTLQMKCDVNTDPLYKPLISYRKMENKRTVQEGMKMRVKKEDE
jgi:hypothetical protein